MNAVDAVEASNTDIGATWVWGLWVVPPKPPTVWNIFSSIFQYMYPRSMLEGSTASTAFRGGM